MPAHLRRRNGVYYLIDGSVRRSLRTRKKGEAEHMLRQYVKGKYGLMPTPTVGEYYERWINAKIEPLYRPSYTRTSRSHFTRILPQFADVHLGAVSTSQLDEFRRELLSEGLNLKTVKNVIGGSFRAMYRDARAEIDELKGRDPFADIHWPTTQRERPEFFTQAEKLKILRWFGRHEPFYHPWVLTQFETGMRPSEASALLVSDVNIKRSEISITKSRHLRRTGAPKTGKSRRTIHVEPHVMAAIKSLPSWRNGRGHLFLNKHGDPITAGRWAQHYWARALEGAGVTHRKFYCTRHTFITEKVEAGYNVKAIADYCGTSMAMIEANYCGVLRLGERVTLGERA